MTRYNLVSLAGIFALVAFAWLLSADRRRVNRRVILWGTGLQMLFAVFVLVVPAGVRVFEAVNDLVVKVLDSASAGTRFVFGRLALPPGAVNEQGESSLGFILAFQALPTIVFFSAVMSLLYYFRIMPRVIQAFARVFARLMRVSGAESLCAASNVFVGVESAFTVRPYLARMTRSELCTVLTAGMATVSSNVMALYVFLLRDTFPNIAGHLVSASILSAPAALVMSKILLPEGEAPETMGQAVECHHERERTMFEAIIAGANGGLKQIFGIVALLLAVLGLVALADLALGWAGRHLGAALGHPLAWSFKGALAYVFYPFTLAMGVPVSEAMTVAGIVGERAVATEVAGYQDLAVAVRAHALSPRSAVIAAYALCGFAHVASMAIFVGGVSALIPARTGDVAGVSVRALVAATLACLLTAAVVGVFLPNTPAVLGRLGVG
jgi:CNT family concentrative nucleoside transporter